MTRPGVCDYCGQEKQDLMPSFWNDRTRWFCDLDCLGRFKSVALGSQYADEALDGAPGTAKKLMEKMKNDAEKANGAVVG
jgi:hypothetical protein